MPASRIAKSPACEDGKRSATKSSKLPVKPRSPGQFGQLAIARVTEVWKRRTCERSEASRSTLTRNAPFLPLRASVALLWIVTLTSAHSPSRRSATASSPSLVVEKRTRS